MSSVNLEDLFDLSRFPAVSPSLITVVLYFPIGVVLAVLRIFIGFHAYLVAWLLPKASLVRQMLLRVMCGVLGFIVIKENGENRQNKCRVLVVNYTTPVDRLAVEILLPCVMPSMWDLPPVLMWLLGYEDMGAKHGRETLIQNTRKHCRESHFPLLAFPEGATTNGRVGLLKFSVWPFALDEPVQPMVVEVVRPSLVSLTPSVAGSYWWSDLFWFLFVPFTCFRVRLLPVASQSTDEDAREFASRVQQSMASSLGVAATSYTSADKIEFLKQRLMLSQQQSSQQRDVRSSSVGGGNNEMVEMVSQVQTVLPHVPAHIVRQDLKLTKDVDLTITNILEGRVSVEASESSVDAEKNRPSSPPRDDKSAVDSSAVAFGRTTAERHMTFAERKKIVFDTARRRYIVKHGLADTTSQHAS